MSLADRQKNRITQRRVLRQQHGRFPWCYWRLCRCHGTCYMRRATLGAVLARGGGAVPYPRPLRSGEIMESVRVVLGGLGLFALPLVAAAAQGQSAANKCKNTPQAGQNGNSQRGAAAVAAAQANKCPAPVPPPAPVPQPAPPPVPPPPPPGINEVHGMVWEDIDGNGVRDPFGGEMGLAGWTVQLFDAN